MTLTSFVGSLKPKNKKRPGPSLTLNTSFASQHLGTIRSGESLDIKSLDISNSSVATSSTWVPPSPTSTEFSLSTSSVESMTSFDTQDTDPDDLVTWVHRPASPTTSDNGEPSRPSSPSSVETVNGKGCGTETPIVPDASDAKKKRRVASSRKERGSHTSFLPSTTPPTPHDHGSSRAGGEPDVISPLPSITSTLISQKYYSSSRISKPRSSTATMKGKGKSTNVPAELDPRSPGSGIVFLQTFLQEHWEPQSEECRVNEATTLASLLAIGKQSNHEGISNCRNLIQCPGLNDEIAVSLWTVLSGSIPTPEDLLLQDDTCSVLSIESVERFMVPRKKSNDESTIASLQLVERCILPQPPAKPRRSSWIIGRSNDISESSTSSSTTSSIPRSRSMASLREWGRRQASMFNEVGVMLGRGYGSQPYDDERELRIFILKAMNGVGMSAQDGLAAMQRYSVDGMK
ncbi:hypothetical protein F5X68DRAFT_227520 [Plectosphaerella plurivora]|uniref:Uncharacterized protein n=1 Tax=Plectosphaerella plurivora TaxID=936078 RepID=A0A9P8VL74_9PEZI|nr:hypothetical protein F5X68DRAFT_227520 [Plectosphaerella plurivora]